MLNSMLLTPTQLLYRSSTDLLTMGHLHHHSSDTDNCLSVWWPNKVI